MKPLQIIIIEDSPRDADLAQRQLKKSGLQFESIVVSSRETLIDTIRELSPDIILSDYAMPQFNGIEALEIRNEIAPHIPFVIVTASINEETAVECIKLGADDYVVKDYLSKLPTAIHNALAKKQMERREREIREEYKKAAIEWQWIFNSLNTGVALLNDDLTILRCNQAMQRIIGKPYDKIVGRPCNEMILGMDEPPPDCPAKSSLQSLQNESWQSSIGERFYQLSTLPVLQENQGTSQIILQIEDITEKKLQDDRTRYLDAVLESIRDVNQLIVREKRKDVLIEKACTSLHSTYGLQGAWIVLVDPHSGKSTVYAQSGYEEGRFDELVRLFIEKGNFPPCCQYVQAAEKTVATIYPEIMCETCPLKDAYLGNTSNVVRIDTGTMLMGYMGVSVPPDFAEDNDEKIMIKEVSDDIAFALRSMDIEAQRNTTLQRQMLHAHILEILNRHNEWFNLIRDILVELKDFSGVEAIGLRLKDKDRFPFYESIGFSQEFLEKEDMENRQNAHDLISCVYNLLKADDSPCNEDLLTKNGSFWTNSSSDLIKHLSENDVWTGLGWMCREGGYETLALVPIQVKEEISGFLQFNSREKGELTEDFISFIEEIANSIGVAFTRQKIERALEESEFKFSLIIEHSPDAVFLADREGNFLYTNPAATELLGYQFEEFREKNYIDLVPRNNVDLVLRRNRELLERKHSSAVLEILHKGGKSVYVDINSVVLPDGNVYGVCRDVTERKRLEEERKAIEARLKRSERLESIGILASGIAHDINNTLAPVTLYTDALMEAKGISNAKSRLFLQKIQSAVKDIERTVGRLRLFYKQKELDVTSQQVIDIRDLFDSVLEITRPRWKDISQKEGVTIDITLDVPEDISHINGNETELREALINLIFNAVDAMKQGGSIRLGVRRSGNNTIIEVEDSGEGMSQEEVDKCLEPFYTTKGEKGTGLGLPMVFGTMRRHGGDVQIISSKGEGTLIQCILPHKSFEEEVPSSDPTILPVPPLRVLLIDDDAEVRRAVREVLSLDSHRVIEAESGRQGIELFRESLGKEEKIDIVLSDLGMPDMDGWETAEELRGLNESTPIVLLTGWGGFMNEEFKEHERVDAIIGKPPKVADIRQVFSKIFSLQIDEE